MQFEIRNTKEKGKGLFTLVPFEPNQVILRFDGTQLFKDQIEDFSGPVAAGHLQIGSKLYLNLKGLPAFFINHHCNPNCYVKISVNKAFLVALRPIKANEEISFDYSCTSTEDASTWSMNCKCSLFKCRGLITGYQSIPEKKRIDYINKDLFPEYVIDDIISRKY